MIRRIEQNEIEEVAKYAYQLNSVPEYKCKSFPADFDNIVEQIRNMINHPNDELLVSVNGNTINENTLTGVMALCVEPEEKYLQAVGGVFAHKNYRLVAMEFYKYLKSHYSGYQFDAAYPEENKQAIDFMISIGAKVLASEYEYRLHKHYFTIQPETFYIIELNEKYHEGFKKIHNKSHPDVYWTGERLLNALDKFDILIALDNSEVIGSVVTSSLSKKAEEIYFIEVKEDRHNHGVATSLLNKAIQKAFCNGTEELTVMLEKENAAAIHLFEKFGFRKTDTCVTLSTII